MPELLASRSVDSISEMNGADELAVIEGGPLDGLQCGEKMWIVVDCQTVPYYDTQFLVSGNNNNIFHPILLFSTYIYYIYPR